MESYLDTFVLGPLFGRHPTTLKPEGHQTLGHTHREDHVTVIWGKHRLVVEVAVLDESGAQKIGPNGPEWKLELDVELAGNGEIKESLVFIAAEKKHNLISLEPNCGHVCLFLHKDGAGKTSREWQGFLMATQ